MHRPYNMRVFSTSMVGLCLLALAVQSARAIDNEEREVFFRNAEYVQLSDDPFTDEPPVIPDGPPRMAVPEVAVPPAMPELATSQPTCSSHGICPQPSCGMYVVPMDGFFVKGWLAQGVTGNPDRPNNRFNIPVTFNDRSNDYQLNQLYLAVGKEVDVACRSWDIGGRLDVMYGSDYFFTQALGLETHQDGSNKWNSEGPRFDEFGNRFALFGTAMPQAYLEFAVPIADATTIKLGHFYTIMGYESVEAPKNFFYSHSYAMQYGEPRTHTGVLATSDIGHCWRFNYGVTRGWDNWENPNGRLGFLGGVAYTSPNNRTSLSFTLHTGNEDAAGDNNRTAYSLVLVREIGCRLTYVFQHDFGIEANRELNNAFEIDDAKWYGINQYLFYRLRDNLDLGWRVEWFRDQDNARVLGIPLDPFVDGGNYVSTTLGLNWRPHRNIVLRPEVRYDVSDVDPPLALDGMFQDFSKDSQLTIALDLIISL